jgi:hypothetical protein
MWYEWWPKIYCQRNGLNMWADSAEYCTGQRKSPEQRNDTQRGQGNELKIAKGNDKGQQRNEWGVSVTDTYCTCWYNKKICDKSGIRTHAPLPRWGWESYALTSRLRPTRPSCPYLLNKSQMWALSCPEVNIALSTKFLGRHIGK